MRFIIYSLFVIFLVSCKSKYIPKVRVWPPSAYHSAMSVDTTYKFKEMLKDSYGYNNYIDFKIPQQLLNAKLTGIVYLFANIDNKGKTINLNIQSMFIKKNGSRFIQYDKNIDKKEPSKKSYTTLKNYLLQATNNFDKISANKISDTLHPTYCVISIQ